MPDSIVTATSKDGTISVAAGITTSLVREAQRRHSLSPTASAALGRLMTGAALLGTSLKGRERLSVQVAGDGPLGSLVADVSLKDATLIGARGYAARPEVDLPLNDSGKFDVGGAVGRGRLQVTVSYEVGQPYVGIVELESGELGDDLAAYLVKSQQIPSVVALGVLADRSGIRAAGGVIVQALPGADERTLERLEAAAARMLPVTEQIDGGATAADLAAAATAGLDISPRGDYGVRFACRCSREKVEIALLGLGREELERIAGEEPETEAICEFCKHRYALTPDEVLGLVRRLGAE
jgi:molecular chaperone Hsp33